MRKDALSGPRPVPFGYSLAFFGPRPLFFRGILAHPTSAHLLALLALASPQPETRTSHNPGRCDKLLLLLLTANHDRHITRVNPQGPIRPHISRFLLDTRRTRPPVPLSQASSRVNWLLQGLAVYCFLRTPTTPPGNSTWPDLPQRASITSKWMQHLLITSIRARAVERTAPRRTLTTSPLLR